MSLEWRFGPDDSEELTLSDGRRVRLRAIRPEDREKMRIGLREMSPQSRYRRFFSDKQSLSDKELDYLTEPDGVCHFALVAGEIDEQGQEGRGAAVARFVALPDSPGVAEPAIVVVDEFQGLGLGRALMDRLISCAVERKIERFRSEVLAMNTPMLNLLDDISVNDKGAPASGVVVCEFALRPELGEELEAHAQRSQSEAPAPPRPASVAAFDRVLRSVAGGRAEINRRIALTERWLGTQIFGAMASEQDTIDKDQGLPIAIPRDD